MSGRGNYPNLLVVMNDLDDAGYVYHDLTQMMGEERVLFFPSSYKRAIKYNQKDAGNEILRTEVLTKVAEMQDLVVVTYPDALAERVVSKKELDENTLAVKVGDEFDISELEKRIFELGFERTDYVYEPGQFAIRGSIVDVYSFSSDMPYRIDFFGDEVDSIRSFDVQSQLSQGKVEMMTIVPEMKTDGTEYISFLEFLPKDTLVVTQSLVYICDKIAQIHEEGFSSQAQFEAETNAETLAAQFIIDEETFKRQIVAFRHLELKQAKTNTPDGLPITGEMSEGQRGSTIHFHTAPQPLFHKNFDLVSQEFHRLMDEGYKICIFADSEKQIARLQNIFEEQAKTEADAIHFTPVNKAIHEGFIDHTLKLCFFTDHQIFDRFHKYNLKSDKAHRGKVALTLKEIQQFEIGDYVVHIDHGVGRFGGLVRIPQGDVMQEMIKITYQNEDTVYVSIHALHKVSKYKGKEGEPPRLNRIGGGAWERMKERVKTKVKDIARDLIQLYAARLKEKGFAYSKDSYMQHELEASFVYEDTPDQLKATQDVKADMEKARPMDRLVCGDVGFGKTEVAIRAAFKAATDGKQVAVMVPTTV
ncbi:MAG: transcription-repair coupling factor, partial [Bacteroidaceae bacterium]|nr:transcription-repair coupling factor [Bacteroidaceae bacterium]